MSVPYQLTPLAETRPGMVLSDVVRDGKGNVLLAQGIVLTESMHVLKDVRGIAFTQFSSADVVRHPMVARIVDAYEKAASMQELGALPGNLTKPVTRHVRKKA